MEKKSDVCGGGDTWLAGVSVLGKGWDPDYVRKVCASQHVVPSQDGQMRVQRGWFYDLEKLQIGCSCYSQNKLPLMRWRTIGGVTDVGTANRQETHRKQEVAGRKEQVQFSSFSLSLFLALPFNRALQEATGKGKNDSWVRDQHHKVNNTKVGLELRDNNLITGPFLYSVAHPHISFI